MEKFKISDIQEIFTSDVERFHSVTQQAVSQLLDEAAPTQSAAALNQEALDEALRQCHTLKGLAATVEAWGLSCLGADFEKLLELAGSWAHHDRPQANEVFQFILDHMQDWFVMNQFTCLDMLPQAWDVYQGLRVIMDDRWPGHLPLTGEVGVDAQYVRLSQLEISEVRAAPAHEPVNELMRDESVSASNSPTQTSQTPELSPAATNGTAPELKADLDVQGAFGGSGLGSGVSAQDAKSHTPDAKTGAPLPVRVVPPPLRHREAAGQESGARREKLESSSSKLPVTSSTAAQPATPKPLPVVPPVLRRRDAKGQESGVRRAKGQELETRSEKLESSSSTLPVTSSSAAQPAKPVNELMRDELETRSEELESSNSQLLTSSSSAGLSPAETTPPTSGIPPTVAKADATATPAPGTSTPPPLLRVAPPALKRRGKVRAKPVNELMKDESVSGSNSPTQTSLTPELSHEAEAAEALSAEAIFAALPEAVGAEARPVEPPHELAAAAGTAVEFKLGKDSDLLEMLSQEVAGYLTELTASLTALAGNLAAPEPWEQTRRLFHTIKGTAATFGLDTVSSPAKAAEARCLVAIEDASARTRETFESCAHRAAVVAKSLHLAFDEGRLRAALETALAQAANAAAASAAIPAATVDPDMAGFFVNDTRDQIGIIEQAVLRWEKGEKPTEQVQAAQRGFHTIKGAGNSIGLTEVAQSVHAVEAFLEGLAAQGASGSKAIFTFLLGAVDQLRRYVVDLTRNPASTRWPHDWSVALGLLGQPGGEGETLEVRSEPLETSSAKLLAAGSDAEDDSVNTIRIEAARLHQLMNLISEMVIDRSRLARKLEQLASLHRALAERQDALTGSVLTFQQQFEFNLGAGLGEKLEVRSEKLGAPSF